MSKLGGAYATTANGCDPATASLALEVLPPAAIASLDGTADGEQEQDRQQEQLLKPRPQTRFTPESRRISKDGTGVALSDTPASSRPGSPKL